MATSRSYQTGKHLEAFILLVISRETLHGGAVINRLKALLPTDWIVDDGHVYRLLRTLEANGALESTWITEVAGAPVRVYRITGTGRIRLNHWKEDIELRVRSLQTFLHLWAHPAENIGDATPHTPT